jgi:hypothetical protein
VQFLVVGNHGGKAGVRVRLLHRLHHDKHGAHGIEKAQILVVPASRKSKNQKIKN